MPGVDGYHDCFVDAFFPSGPTWFTSTFNGLRIIGLDTYDKPPRANVHVLASVDEKTYTPNTDIKMGDHPVVWTNEHKRARNIYIFMGHRPEHFDNKAFTQLFENSIFWAAGQEKGAK